MNFKKTGIRIKDIENIKPHFIKLDSKTKKVLGLDNKQKTASDYLKEYLGENKLFDSYNEKWIEAINKTLPKRIKENCLYCNGNSSDEMDKKCTLFHTESQMNLFFATREFVAIIEQNKHLFNDKQILKKLTIKFFEGFLFQDGRVFYSIDAIVMECLKEGFYTISQFFSNNPNFVNLELINNSLDVINDELLQIVLNGDEEPIHIKPQKMFFENKRDYIYEKMKIEELKRNQENNTNDNITKSEPKHNNIFVDNHFFTWERLFEAFKINETKRTDLRFLYEVMIIEGIIHNTVSVTNFKDWLNDTYEYSIDKLHYTPIKASSNQKRLALYNAIK